MENIINREEAQFLIETTHGKFFTVTFLKKDNSVRIMNARLGVKKHLNGGVLKYSPKEKELIPVYDLQSKGYRMINLNTLISLKINNKEYTIKTK